MFVIRTGTFSSNEYVLERLMRRVFLNTLSLWLSGHLGHESVLSYGGLNMYQSLVRSSPHVSRENVRGVSIGIVDP